MSDMNAINDQTLERTYRAMLERRAKGQDRRACATPEELLAVVEGKAPEPERVRILRHVGSCALCHKELELLRLTADVVEQVARPQWTSRPVLAAAAGVVLLIGGVALWSRRGGVGGSGTEIERGTGAIALMSPREDSAVTRPLTLIWASDSGTPRYQLELLDRDGSPLYLMTTRDTTAAIPDSVPLEPGKEYRWWVRALRADGTQPASTVRRLRIAP